MQKTKFVIPPHNTEAEQAILAGILINNGILNDLITNIGPDDFYKEAHRHIYRAMISIYDQGIDVDLISLSDTLRKRELFERAGGLEYLSFLVEAASTSAGSAYHAELVKDSSIRRRLLHTCQEIQERCLYSRDETKQLLDSAEQSIFGLAGARIKQGLEPLSDSLQSSYKIVERSKAGQLSGLATHYIDIDRMTGGLQPKELIILAARPGMGKTTLALNIAQNMASEGAGVAVFSLEMSKEQLGLRLMASEGRVDTFKLKVGQLGGKDYESLLKAAQRLAELPIFIDDTPDINVLEVRAKIRRLERRQKFNLVIIDYLQLMKPAVPRNSREKEVAEISSGLKALAKTFEVPVLALSQLNRRIEARDIKRPELADLRESGSIEQDADMIAFISRPEVYKRTPNNRGKAEIIFAKNRNGPTGTVNLNYLDKYTRFENYVEEYL